MYQKNIHNNQLLLKDFIMYYQILCHKIPVMWKYTLRGKLVNNYIPGEHGDEPADQHQQQTEEEPRHGNTYQLHQVIPIYPDRCRGWI